MSPPEGNPNVSNPVVSNEWKSEKIQRVCFRGDDRSPEQLYSDHFLQPTTIMGSGLQSQDPSLSPSYRVKQEGAIGDAENGVCVSRLFQTAVRFPLLSARTMTWIYAVWVARAYDTHRRQTLHAMDLIMKDQLRYASMSEQEIKDTLWSLFGEELVVHQIPAHHVISAVSAPAKIQGTLRTGICRSGISLRAPCGSIRIAKSRSLSAKPQLIFSPKNSRTTHRDNPRL